MMCLNECLDIHTTRCFKDFCFSRTNTTNTWQCFEWIGCENFIKLKWIQFENIFVWHRLRSEVKSLSVIWICLEEFSISFCLIPFDNIYFISIVDATGIIALHTHTTNPTKIISHVFDEYYWSESIARLLFTINSPSIHHQFTINLLWIHFDSYSMKFWMFKFWANSMRQYERN